MGAEKRDRGLLRVDANECKGCGLCVEACPPKVIHLSEGLNHYGYRTASYAGAGCTGCGICFMACPEPGAITVLRLLSRMGAGLGLHGDIEGAIECASN
jgi:2-oxoglutarate ferredoxin oxidoreductase subunit delta